MKRQYVAKVGAGKATHGIKGEEWSYTQTNHTVCGKEATAVEHMNSGAEIEITCRNCIRIMPRTLIIETTEVDYSAVAMRKGKEQMTENMTQEQSDYAAVAYEYALKTLLWSEIIALPCNESEVAESGHAEMEGRPFDEFFNPEDINGDTDTLREQIEAFVTDNWEDLTGMDAEQCGHDFILTRNGHGAGFWDRGLGERGDRLTESAKPYGECSLYLTDYDRVSLSA